MTIGDVYVVVMLGAVVFGIAITVGWWLDHGFALREAWREYRRRSADLHRVQRARARGTEARHFLDAPRYEEDPSPRPPARSGHGPAARTKGRR